MSQFNAYFSTLAITYLLEAYALRKMNVVSEDELILNITSMVSVMGTKDNIAIPAQNKQLYAEMLNKNSGTMMIVLDELVNATYIIRNKNNNVDTTYMINFEHDYIKKFIASHGSALKYVSHPSYSLKRRLEQNEENSLCNAIEKMKISSEAPVTPLNSKTMSINSSPERKKKKYSEEEDYEENTNLVAKLDKELANVEDESVEEEIFYVKSESNPKVKYSVTSTSCTCPAFTYGKGKPCKHMDSIDFDELNLNHTSKKVSKVKNNSNTINSEMIIKNIYSVQTESHLDKFYNICEDTNGTFTCTCASYKYQYAKTKGQCKHIHGFLANHYQKYDKFTLLFNFPGKKDNDNTPVLLIDSNLNTFKNHFDQKLYTNILISNYVNNDTKYHGLYVWAFDDSLTDSKLEKEAVMKENQEYMKEKNNS
jgi:hypothetical protein